MTIQQVKVPSFKSICLSEQEKTKASELMSQLKNEVSQNRQKTIKDQLFVVFDKHLKNEASKKARNIFNRDDFLQKLYLHFFEGVENFKSEKNSLNLILDSVNNIKPNKDDLIERPNKYTFSLDRSIKDSSTKTFADNLIETNLPVYKSSKNQGENAININIIDDLLKNTDLKEDEIRIVKERAKGNKYYEIGENCNICSSLARDKTLVAIAKIQDKNSILPIEFEKRADEIINIFELKNDKKQILDLLVNYTRLRTMDLEKTKMRLNETAKKLNISQEKFVQACLKHAVMFSMTSEKTVAKIKNAAKILNINEKDYVNAILEHPSLFTLSPKTILKNITETSEKLGISINEYKKAALKQECLFYQKSETILNNINTTANLLNIEPEKYIKAALVQPQLFYQSPKTIQSNIETAAKLLGITVESYTKAALQQQPLFYRNPQSINANIENISQSLNIPKKQIVDIALKMPPLFSLNSDNVIKKSNLINYLKQIQGKKPVAATKTLSLASMKNYYASILKHYILKQEEGKIYSSHIQKNLVDYIKKHDKTIYEFSIPNNPLAKDVIEFAQNFSMKNLGKNIFKILIKK